MQQVEVIYTRACIHQSTFLNIEELWGFFFDFSGLFVSYFDSAVKLHPFEKCSILILVALGRLFEKGELPEE